MGRQMPTHLVVLGHPGAESFNAAIAKRYVETVRAAHQVAVLRDLYALGFDPLLKESERTANGVENASTDIQVELKILEDCDTLTFVYPLWFGKPPAIITGYIDRVLGAGFRVDDLLRSSQGMLRGKQLAVITTSGSKLTWLEEQGIWVSLRQSFDKYLQTVFGFRQCDHYHADSVGENLSPAAAEGILFEVGEFARKVCASAATVRQA